MRRVGEGVGVLDRKAGLAQAAQSVDGCQDADVAGLDEVFAQKTKVDGAADEVRIGSVHVAKAFFASLPAHDGLADPLLYESVNVAGTTTLLEMARQTPNTHFVFGSSSSVYGSVTRPPFTEDAAADRPTSPYAATKRSGELLAHAYHHIYGMPATCLRFFTVYGPRQRPDMAIHKFTRTIDQGMRVTIFGDGGSVRDYTYVADIAQGVLRATQTPNGFRVFNLGSSHTTTLRDLVLMIAQRLDRPLLVDSAPDQPGDVPLTHADIPRAREALGYEPQTTIGDGLSKFVAWYNGTRRGY